MPAVARGRSGRLAGATKEEGKEQTGALFSVETGWTFSTLEEAHCDVELSNPLAPFHVFKRNFMQFGE